MCLTTVQYDDKIDTHPSPSAPITTGYQVKRRVYDYSKITIESGPEFIPNTYKSVFQGNSNMQHPGKWMNYKKTGLHQNAGRYELLPYSSWNRGFHVYHKKADAKVLCDYMNAHPDTKIFCVVKVACKDRIAIGTQVQPSNDYEHTTLAAVSVFENTKILREVK